MMYNLENHWGFCVVMVIECSLASGEMELGGVRGRRGTILIAFCE